MDKIKDEIAAERGGPRWLYPSLQGDTPVKFMNFWSCMSASGVNGTPSRATSEKGEKMIELSLARLVDIAREFRDLDPPPREDHRISR
jgi:creatinine amidohydrolase/Fe(II)-dependent formamide hydrolase-like protein